MLNVRVSYQTKNSALSYALFTLLTDFLGLNFKLETYEGDFIEITRSSDCDDLFKLTLDTSFFRKAKQYWMQPQSMPVLPLATWTPMDDGVNANLIVSSVPILYGSPGLVKNDNQLHLNLDIFGSAFFMLSNYEETIITGRDEHKRFPSYLSYAYKNNFLNRPLVDEYVDILRTCLSMLWPDINFKERKFSINASHDIDQVSRYQTRNNFYQYLRAIGGDFSRGFLKDLIYSPLSYFSNKDKLSLYDPYNTFNWLMDISEENNIKSTFNFISGKSSKNNADYNIEDNKIRKLIRKIHERGHIIGIHPSYDCYDNPNLIKNELRLLRNVLKSLNIKQENITSRMHYLRWKSPDTLTYLNSAGISKDTTLCYADYIGFRCGTCHTYTGYDLINKTILNIKIEPLILMDCTLFDYMKLNYKQSYDVALDMKKKCQKMNGQFNILWHNSYLQSSRQKIFYQDLFQY